ncbi:MAG: hypothetical protein COA79_04660 [Planctomycetota bacterium]|nr:MAG: hypothetical protein COA79_04660 [Planctomycetota bacterium]
MITNNNSIKIGGKPFERGQKIGTFFKSKIESALSIWEKHFFDINNVRLIDYVEFIQKEKCFQSIIEKYAPDYLDEVKGIAESAEISYPLLYAWQLADENYWLIESFKNNASIEKEGCTTFGVLKENQMILMGQNLDIPCYKNGLQTILKLDMGGMEQCIFTQAGLLGSFGCNNSGIALCVNTVAQLGHDLNGLPVSYMVRKVLESSTIDEAEDKLKSIPHASGQNYLLGGHGKINNYECISRQVKKIPLEESNYICHTNHPVAKENVKLTVADSFFSSTSKDRYCQLDEFLSQNKLKSVEEIMKTMFQKPVFIDQKEPVKGIATFHMAYFILDQDTQAFYFDLNGNAENFLKIL